MRGKKEVEKSDRPAVDVERDLAAYAANEKRHKRQRQLVLVTVILVICSLVVCVLHGVFGALPQPSGAPDGETGTTGTTEHDGTESDSSRPPEPTGDGSDAGELYRFDPSAGVDGEALIRPMDLSEVGRGNTYIVNETGLCPEFVPEAMSAVQLTRQMLNSGEPLVLILHSHTTEAYLPEGSLSCDISGNYARTEDENANMLAVGAVLAETLNAAGIRTLHCTEIFDSPSVRGAYERAACTIKTYLETYPSIRCVIDVHRDSVTDSAGNLIRAVTEVEGKRTAQVMCVVGTDENGTECPWMSNYTLAQSLRAALNQTYGELCRPTVLRSSSYNQQYATSSLLLEIGTCANSVAEAENAARLVGRTLAMLIAGD